MQSSFWDVANSSWNYFSKYSYTYDANHNLVALACRKSDIQNPSSWKNYTQRLYTYDPLNRITSILYQTWNEAAATWEDNTSYAYTYSGDDVVRLDREWNTTAQNWDNKAQTLSHYSPDGNVQYTLTLLWDTAKADFSEDIKLLFSYDGNNAIDTLTTQYWSGTQYKDFSKKIYKNNAHGLPEEVVTKFWNNHTWVLLQGIAKFHYYYETYTNVNDRKKTSPSVRTFPSPAHQTLNMEIRWEEAQAFIATVTDVQGRVWKRWNVPMVKEYKETVDIRTLPEGHYFISINGAKGKATQRFSVERP